PPTALRAALLDATGARDANDALHRFYSDAWPRSRIAALAPLVEAAAAEGDAAAVKILRHAAQELALLAAAVRSQLWDPGDPVELVYIGGAFRSRPLLEQFRMLAELEQGNRCGPPKRGPAEGALLEAYRAAGMLLPPTLD
ncbi:MAG: ATPase, partial [Acidobacteriia bacterium]|nr:ATPase [Terriglobia bacterium]